MKDAFGNGQPFRVGVEEELLLVDARTGRMVDDAVRLLGEAGFPEGRAAPEAYASEIEFRGGPASGGLEAVRGLERMRALARAAGATLLGAGVHPAGGLGDARLVDAERYRRVLEEMRGLIQRTPECALHVHVGMPDREAAVRAFNGLRGWLPLLLGLAASSPLWFGTDSGMASARAALVRAYPGRGVPRPLRDFDDYERALEQIAAGGGPDDYTLIWWDVRPHPRLGTLEVREMDAQSRLLDVAALAALVRGLARHEAESAEAPLPSETIAWSCFRAARDGLGAEIQHDGRLAPLPEAARAAVELARPHAREAGDDEALDAVERILREGNGADRQRRAYLDGDMEAVLELLVEETARPL